MSLIDRLREPTKNYISFKDLLLHLSGSNNQPVYEVVTYLLHHDLPDIDFYYIDTDYKIIQADFNDKSITYFLNNIQTSLLFGAENWIFHDGKSLEQLSDDFRQNIKKHCFDNIHAFFKKSDLLSFEPLNGLLHFNPESIADANSVEQQLANALAKIDELEQSKADGSFSMGTPTVAHGEPKTYEQLVEALTAANAKIKQQEQDIEKLNGQLNKQADKPLRYNSEMGVARMLYAILTEHNYDLSATKGKANNLIEKASQLHGTPVARNFIAKWIELSNQAKSDSTK